MVIMKKHFSFFISKVTNHPIIIYGAPLVLLIIPIALLVLPADFFDTGQSVCLSVVFFNTECFGCGMTRAIMHLIHFDVDGAIEYNLLSFIVLPALIILWFIYFIQSIKKLNKLRATTKKGLSNA